MYERMALNWVLEHQFSFLKALLFVMMDLTKEVSSGAVDLAKHNLENMLVKCSQEIPDTKENEEALAAQKKSFHEVTHELVRQITSPNTIVREQVCLQFLMHARYCLCLISINLFDRLIYQTL